MTAELGNFLLTMGLGFGGVQVMASFWGIWKGSFQSHKQPYRFLEVGRATSFFQAGFISAAFGVLIWAFLACDFSLLVVALHDHTQLPWYYRLAATWGHHEGSLLFFVLILSGVSAAFGFFLKPSLFRGRALVFQGLLTLLFLGFLFLTSNPFMAFPFSLLEGKSLNPLLQDKGLLMHPPFLYLGYVGFSAPFSLTLAALWEGGAAETWVHLVRPWVLLPWAMLTAGIALGSWWAYYELGWGGWWFWDPVENASLMPWLAGTALLHVLWSQAFYRWSLFLSLLTFGLSLLSTFLVRSGLITSVHSFAQSPERGRVILCLIGGIMGSAFCLWAWKASHVRSLSVPFFSRQGVLFLNSLFLCVGLATIILGTFYPLWSEMMRGEPLAIGAPYFERTFVLLMLPLLVMVPIGSLLREKTESLFSFLMGPLAATLGVIVLLLYVFSPVSLWVVCGMSGGVWVFGGTAVAFFKNRLSLGATLAHVGVALSLLGVSVGSGFRIDKTQVLGLQEILTLGHLELTLQNVQQGKGATYLYEKATLTFPGGTMTPEKRLYQPQQSLLSETAISTNGVRDLYVILGPYQGNNRWLIRASLIPLAPWIWIGGVFMVLGALVAFLRAIGQKNRSFGLLCL